MCKNYKIILLLLPSLCFVTAIVSGPINNDSALTVAKGLIIFREQIKYTKKSHDPSPLNRIAKILEVPSVLLYGLTEKIVLIGKYPFFRKKLMVRESGGYKTRKSFGFGDLTIRGKFRFFTSDEPGKTTRASVIAGIKFPTGSSRKKDCFGEIPRSIQLGTGSWDFPFGLVYTNVTLQREIDIVAQFKVNTKDKIGFKFGNIFRHDLSYQYRIFPKKVTATSSFIYAVIEANGIWKQKNKNCAIVDNNSGGYTLFISPGLQYVRERFVAEIAVQIPAIQKLNGQQPKVRFSFVAGFRALF